MIKNLVESTFQRATVAADYDELSVSVGKLRHQLTDLRHVLRETHQEMDRMKAELRELKQARRYDGTRADRSSAGRSPSRSDSVATAFGKSLARQLGTRTGQAIVRGILGSLFKSR